MRRMMGILVLSSALAAAGAGGFGGYGFGAAFPGGSALQARLQAHGLNLQESMIIHGGQGYGFGGNLIIGGFGYGGAARAERADLIVEFSGGGGGFEIGRIWEVGPGRLALMAALGGMGYELKFRPKLEDVSFDSLVQDPRRVADLTTGSPLIGASGMAIFPVLPFFSLGLKVGALYLPTIGSWKLTDGAAVFDAPKLRPFTYSAQVLLLFGGGRKIQKSPKP